MIKNSDCIYLIGTTHTTCDDFSHQLSWEKHGHQFHIGIVADGCSKSKNSAMGSRLIVSEIIRKCKYFLSDFENFLEILKTEIKIVIKEIFDTYNEIYGPDFIDCTLLISITEDNVTKVLVIGDGSILIKYKNNNFKFIKLDFENNAPAYASYLINDMRRKEYFNLSSFMTFDELEQAGNITTRKETKVSFDSIPMTEYIFNHSELSMLMLFTDGLSSFADKQGTSVVDWTEYAKRMIDVKGQKGVFIKRQVNGIINEEKLKMISNHDDISVSALIIE